MSRTRRILKELADVEADVESGITVKPVTEGDISHLKGYFKGPPGTPYEGGVFVVDIKIPQEYKWSPVLTVKASLISLQSLLQSPEPNDPQDAEVAKHFLRDKAGFDSTAKVWTNTYAKQENPADEDPLALYGLDPEFVKSFEDMGFAQEKIIEVMRRLGIKKPGDDAQATSNRVLEELLK